jgi:CMP/dCMP kinase
LTAAKLTIAIDGFSSCGKSTFAKAIAEELNYIYVDSGAMYRAITLFAIRKGFVSGQVVSENELLEVIGSAEIRLSKNQASGKTETYLNGENVEEEIRDILVSQSVSAVSKIKEVRAKMVEQQRLMSQDKGVVMDGRDIGTVVFPNAGLKIFMTADKDIRAKRRYDELKAKGLLVNLEEIKQNIEDRDYQDTTREESPLKQAPDAIVLDNSFMTPAQQMEWFKKIMATKL